MRILWILFLPFSCSAKLFDDPSSTAHSPLDNGSPAVVNKAPFWDNGDQYAQLMPACEMACLEHVMGALKMFFVAGNISATKDDICTHYRDAEKCMGPLTQCQDTLFPVVTSGIRYMCVDQKEAFDVLIECVDWNSPVIKKECDLQCHPHSLATGLAVKDTVMQTLDQPIVNQAVNMRDLIEPHIGRLIFSEGCRITECLLNCYKTKFNMMCEGTAGSLIMEVLSRPLTHHEAPIGTQFLSAFVGGLLPHTCSFLNSQSRKSFRIDPELDSEIKRMYSGRKKLSEMDMRVLANPADIMNPFRSLPSDLRSSSPLESETFVKVDGIADRSHSTASVPTAPFQLKQGVPQKIVVSGDTLLEIQCGNV